MKRFFILLLICSVLTAMPVMAADTPSTLAFSPADFHQADLLGICITDLPDKDCTLQCSGRTILPGDILTTGQIADMELSTTSEAPTIAELTYLPVFSNGIGDTQTLYVSLRGTKNQPPVAADSSTETYKNLALTEKLNCSDPEGDALTYQLVKEPKRGDVVLHEDGTFTYTPSKEKVGKDSFRYTATDTDGNVSQEACVTVQIQKSISSGVFADMTGDPNEREALFLRSNGLLSGEYVALNLCFRPDQPVSYEEYLMMAMKLTGLEPEPESVESGWFAPWQTAALRAGLSAPSGDNYTVMDAAVLTAGLLDLPADPAVSVFSNGSESIAAGCIHALHQAGLSSFTKNTGNVLTRRDAAVLLYELHNYCKDNDVSFPWSA